jgi:hypothetical protein
LERCGSLAVGFEDTASAITTPADGTRDAAAANAMIGGPGWNKPAWRGLWVPCILG